MSYVVVYITVLPASILISLESGFLKRAYSLKRIYRMVKADFIGLYSILYKLLQEKMRYYTYSYTLLSSLGIIKQ